jgi:hypothetical protein
MRSKGSPQAGMSFLEDSGACLISVHDRKDFLEAGLGGTRDHRCSMGTADKSKLADEPDMIGPWIAVFDGKDTSRVCR